MRDPANSRNRPGQPGFTLVELLTVIGIIALLAAMLLPALSRSQRTARRALCLSNVRMVGQAMRLYVDDYEGTFPGSWLPGPAGGSPPHSYDFVGAAGTSPTWSTPADKRVLNPYLGIAGGASTPAVGEVLRVARCPLDKGGTNQHGFLKLGSSYVFYDREYEEIRQGRFVIWEGAWAIEGHRESEIGSPIRKMVVADLVVQASGDLGGWHDSASARRSSKVSMVFADGHAASVRRRTGSNDLFNATANRTDIERLIVTADYY